jgi:chromosome segregation ATPase
MLQRQAELDAAERDVAAFKRDNAELLPDLYEKNLQRLQTQEADLAARQVELAGARGQFETMRDQLASSNPIVAKLEESIVQVTADLTALRARYASGHSEVQAAERRLKRLREERQSLIEAMHGIETVDIDGLWRFATSVSSLASERDRDGRQVPLLVSQLLRLQDAKTKVATLEQQIETLRRSIGALRQYIVAYTPIEQRRKDLEARVTKIRASRLEPSKRRKG